MRVHCLRKKYDVYIGRGKDPFTGETSIWKNPFIIGRDGSRKDVLKKFEKYLPENKYLMSRLGELRGKILGCWCEEDEECHGDIIIKILKEKGE